MKITVDGDRVLVSVRAAPRAGRTAIAGVQPDGAVKIKLAAPPVDGAANDELIRFLARDVLGVPLSSVSVVRGETGRDKVVAVAHANADDVLRRINERMAG